MAVAKTKAAPQVTDAAARRSVIDTALDMSRRRLSPGRSGNVSSRWKDGMLITPSGIPYDEIMPADIVFVDGAGKVPAKARKPSSEWQFHLAAYVARPDMAAVVHTHSLHATVLACAHKPIPAFHYMVAAAGGEDIPCVPYATFGTAELSAHVAGGVKSRNACLMANHGAIALGKTLASALDLAADVEILAEQYCKVLMLGKPKLLSSAEMAIVLEKFKGYGQNAQK
jgi:L-fuculose-phosphate aldolase